MPNEQGLVSVIIPAFNRVKYIEKTVESVLSQSYSQVEIIVVDDGSTDGTYEALQRYASCGMIILLEHECRQNLGQSVSINVGLSHACGEYIAILDSDDYYSQSAIQTLVDAMSADPGVGLVYGYGEAVDSEGRSLGYKTLPDDHDENGDPNALLLNCYIALPGGALIRAEVLRRVGGFEEAFRASQDHDMALRIFEVTDVRYVPKGVFFYRKHSDAISTKSLERRWRTGFEILKRASQRYPYATSTIRKRRAVLSFRLGHILLKENKPLKALPFLLLSGVLDPLRALNVIFGKERVR